MPYDMLVSVLVMPPEVMKSDVVRCHSHPLSSHKHRVGSLATSNRTGIDKEGREWRSKHELSIFP